MKKKFLLAAMLTLTLGCFGQTIVSQNVSHSSGSPDNTNGCSYIMLIVNYTVNGVGYSVASSNVTLDEGASTTLTATVPALRGLTINDKKLRISAPNGTYFYTITGGSNFEESINDVCFCDNDVRSKVLWVSETTSNIDYLFTHDMCCSDCGY